MLPPKAPGGLELWTPGTVTPGSPTTGSGATAMIPMKGASGTWMSGEKSATSRPSTMPVRITCRVPGGMSSGGSSASTPG